MSDPAVSFPCSVIGVLSISVLIASATTDLPDDYFSSLLLLPVCAIRRGRSLHSSLLRPARACSVSLLQRRNDGEHHTPPSLLSSLFPILTIADLLPSLPRQPSSLTRFASPSFVVASRRLPFADLSLPRSILSLYRLLPSSSPIAAPIRSTKPSSTRSP